MLSGARYGAHTQENCLEPFVWIRILLRIIKMLLGGSQEGLITMLSRKCSHINFKPGLPPKLCLLNLIKRYQPLQSFAHFISYIVRFHKTVHYAAIHYITFISSQIFVTHPSRNMLWSWYQKWFMGSNCRCSTGPLQIYMESETDPTSNIQIFCLKNENSRKWEVRVEIS